MSLDTIPVSAFFALKESFKIFSSSYLITVISIRLYSCSLLSKCGFFGLLFLEIQNGCWFQHFCPFAVSEKQNSPDLAFAPFLARGLSIKQFEYSTHIHNSDFLGPSQTVPSGSRCSSLHCRLLPISPCLKATVLLGALPTVMWVYF